MLFAESHDAVWQTLITAVAGLVLAYMQWRTKNSVERSGSQATKAAQEAAANAAQVKTALLDNDRATSGKLEAVKTALVEKADAAEMALAENTALTGEVKRLVNGQNEALVAKIAALEKRLAERDGPHPERGTP